MLEANVALLFARAWAPVQVEPRFRAALIELIGERMGEHLAERVRALPPVRPARPSWSWPSRLLPIAAALVLALGALVVWRLASSDSAAPSAPVAGGTPELPDPLHPIGSERLGPVAPRPEAELVAVPAEDGRTAVASTTLDEPADSAPPLVVETAPRLVGRVTAAGQPLERFRIALLREVRLPNVAEPSFYAFTDAADGRFALADEVPAGTYTLFVLGDGLALGRVGSLVLGAGESPMVEIDLARGLTLRGRVLDRASGRPIEGALVLSERDTPHQIVPFWVGTPDRTMPAGVLTAPDGSFELRHLSAGPHVLRVSHPGHGPTWTSPLEPGLADEELVIQLGCPARIVGTARDAAGRPRVAAEIVASYIDYTFQQRLMSYGYGVTDELGAFSIDDLPGGSFVIIDPSQAIGRGGPPNVRSVTIAECETLEICLPECHETTTVHGRLLSAEGLPVPDRDLVAFAAGDEQHFLSARTSSEGAYEIALAPGRWLVYQGVRMGQDMLLVGLIEVPPVAELERDLVLGAGEIAGRLRRSASDAPLRDAWIVLRRTDVEGPGLDFMGKTPAEPDGRFRFTGLQAGLYELSAYAPGCAPTRIEGLSLVPGDRIDAPELVLEPGGALVVHVRDAAGQPAAGLPLALADTEGRTLDLGPLSMTDAQGRVHIDGMTPGTWTVRASRDGAHASGEVRIDVDQTSELLLELSVPLRNDLEERDR